MAQYSATEQPLEVVVDVDETARIFPDGNNAGVSLDGEISADLDSNGSSFSTKPDPRLRRALFIMVPVVIFTGIAAVIGLIMHATGTAHPGSRIRPGTNSTTSATTATNPPSPVSPVIRAPRPLIAPVPQTAPATGL